MNMPTEATIDFYKTLGVEKDATEKEIKKAYRKLSLEHHPDQGGDEEEFKKITEAYEVLSDTEAKEIYDSTGYYETERSIDTQAKERLCAVFVSMLAQVTTASYDRNPLHHTKDILKELKKTIRRVRSEFETAFKSFDTSISSIQSDIKILKYVKDHIMHNETGNDNILSKVVDAKIEAMKQELVHTEHAKKAQERELEIANRVYEMCDDYSYIVEAMKDSEDVETKTISPMKTSRLLNITGYNEKYEDE